MAADNAGKQADSQKTKEAANAEPVMIRTYYDGHKGATAFFRNRPFLNRLVSIQEQLDGSVVSVLVHASSICAEPYSR